MDRDRQINGRVSGGRSSDDTADYQYTRGGLYMSSNSKHPAKAGSLGGEMRGRVKQHTAKMSNRTRSNYMRACRLFDAFRKRVGLSNNAVRQDPRVALERWRDDLLANGYAVSTVHTYIAGAACGLGVSMAGLARHGTAADKIKSLGLCERTQQARQRPENAEIVRFQAMVGGRRSATLRLTGSDFIQDESGEWCVRFLGDKGGKDQLQRIAPDDVEDVRRYFEAVAPDERLFPQIDCHLDLHQIRAEHARREYTRYAQICSTPEGRVRMREQLWARFTDPDIGCKAFLLAKARNNTAQMRSICARFAQQMKDGTYYLQRDNRQVALQRGLPVGYDRLALCCVSVFALSHWRCSVAVKSYML